MSKISPKVSVVILNYNGCAHTIKCLKALDIISFKDKEIILFNNGSTDETSIVVKKKFPQVKLIEQQPNIGFCRGNNEAIKYCKGEYILLLNNDTLVTGTFLHPLVYFLEKHKNVAIVQPKIIHYKSKKLQSGSAFLTRSGFLYYYGYNQDSNNKKFNISEQIYSANGACMLVRRKVINKIGLFDEDYFSYVEETDFCHRALLAGYQVWYEPKAVIFHIGGLDNSRYSQSDLIYNAYRNRITTYLKNLELINLLKILPITIFCYLIAAIIYLAFRKPRNSLAIINGLVYNIIYYRKTLRKRKTIQSKTRRCKDKDFLPRVTRNPRFDYYIGLFNGLEKYKD